MNCRWALTVAIQVKYKHYNEIRGWKKISYIGDISIFKIKLERNNNISGNNTI